MADGRKGVRWLVEMVLDKSSARKVRKEAQDALSDSTSSGRATQNLRTIERGFDRIRGAATRVRAAIFSVQGMLAGIGLGIGAGAAMKFLVDANRQFQSLLAQLKVLEGSADGARRVFNAIEDFARRTPFQIEEITESYIRLRAAGIAPTEEMLASFGDLAAARGKTLLDLSMAVEDALVGERERLKEFGIVAREEGEQLMLTFNGQTTAIENTRGALLDWLEEVGRSQGIQGSMEEQMATLNGAISNLWDNLGTLARTVGEQGGVNEVLQDAAGNVSDLTTKVNENAGAVAAWTKLTLEAGAAVIQTLVFPVRIAWNALTGLLRIIGAIFTSFGWGISRAAEFILDRAGDIADALGFDGMAADIRRWADAQAAGAERLAETNRQLWEGVAQDGRDSLDAIVDLGNSYRDLAGAIAGVTREHEKLTREAGFSTDAVAPPSGGGGGGGGGEGSIAPRPGLAGVGGLRTPNIIRSVRLPKPEVSAWDDAFNYLRENSWAVSYSMTDAFGEFFTALAHGFSASRDGFHSLVDAAKGIGGAIVGSLAEGWAGFSMARGTAALAEGTWPPNPAAIWSATKWFAAAGMFRALDSALAGAGRSAAVAPVGMPASVGVAERAERVGAEVNLFINPWDPANPLMQDSVHAAQQYATERYGPNTRVNVRPYPRGGAR